MNFIQSRMYPLRLVRAVLVAGAVLVVACGDPTRQQATYTNALQSFSIYTLTGAPPAVANALSFLGGTTRASSTFAFDLAFELDASGRPVAYPVRLLSGALAGTPKRVGLQAVPGGFDALTEVPATGYDTARVLTLAAGQAVAVEIRDANACFTVSYLSPAASQFIYAKFVVDSVATATKKIYGRTVIDPNCGYRGVVPNEIPKN